VPPDDPELNEVRGRFLDALGKLRPTVHRYCARMCGSVLDGEDLVQETLAAAAHKVSLGNPGFLEPSLLRMAHERCMTFARLDLGRRERTVMYGEGLIRAIGPQQKWTEAPIDSGLESRVSVLRPFDRAAVLIMDVLGFSIQDTAALIVTTVGALKIALLRARATLRELPPLTPSAPIDSEQLAMLREYAVCFNRLNVEGIHRLVRDDARVEIVGAFNGRMRDLESIYAGAYAATPWEWRQSAARVDGDPVLITSRRVGEEWHPYSAIQLWWEGGRVVRIRDYMQIRYILRDARIEPALEPPETTRMSRDPR
jgi:RNA polymerase sigma-70 factor (ECF subfamily)